MFKKVFSVFIFLFLLFVFAKPSFASDPHFDISVNAKYDIHDDGITTVSQTITITNKTEFYYTPTYTVSVGFGDIENIQATNKDGVIPTTLDDKNPNSKSIKLAFPKRYTGLSESNAFTLQFDTKDIAKKQGNIWEVNIPGIEEPDDFSNYNSTITVPPSFGLASIIKPSTKGATSDKIVLSKDEIGKSGVYILYGDKQYYSFSLKYNISNPNLFPVSTEIALPPQTNYQNVITSSFSILPEDVRRDSDGNWIAEYKLSPQQKEQVVVNGVVEVLSQPQSEELSAQQISNYTKSVKFWNTKDNEILKVAATLATPQDIYDYVVKTLSYNYSKIATDNIRLGGGGALKDPKNSVCLEFTDLFVTLARAKGIPARSVEGFAYTQNSKLRPLSLVNDILHAWPEYYDKGQKKWIMVDPTWGNTTKGMDYFNSLDFQHVAFVVKGEDSEYPIPAGGYKFDRESKDVEMRFAKESDFFPQQKISVTDTFPNFSFPKVALQGTFIIKNEGNTPIIDTVAYVTTSRGTARQFLVDYIPPDGTKKLTTSFSDTPFLTNGRELIKMQVGKRSYTKSVRISFIPDLQLLLLIGGIIGGSIIIAAVTYTSGSLLVQRFKR